MENEFESDHEMPVLFECIEEPEVRFSYAIRCLPILNNLRLNLVPFSLLDKDLARKRLSSPDIEGRLQVMGIFQESKPRSEAAEIEQARNERFVDEIIEIGGRGNPMFSYDHYRRDLISVVYEPIDDDFLKKVQEKMPEYRLKAREKFLDSISEVERQIRKASDLKTKPKRKMSNHDLMKFYVGHEDILRRLAVYQLSDMPDFRLKEVRFITDFYRMIQGEKISELEKYTEAALGVMDKAIETRNTFGLTREESLILESSVFPLVERVQKESIGRWHESY